MYRHLKGPPLRVYGKPHMFLKHEDGKWYCVWPLRDGYNAAAFDESPREAYERAKSYWDKKRRTAED